MGKALLNVAALIIEPDEDILEIVSTVLTLEGIKVLAFRSFSESLVDIFNQYKVGIVVLAFRAGGEDAIYALQKIKKFVTVPIIAMSCDMDIAEKSSENGFDGHIAKPFDIDELFRFVSSTIKGF